MSEAVDPAAAPADAIPEPSEGAEEPTDPATAAPEAPAFAPPEAPPDAGPVPQAAPRAAARATNVVKVYGTGDTAVRALDGVSVNFQAGRFTAIMGPSGSGKSTLMHCVAGLDSVTSGKVYIDDTDLTELDDRALTRVRREHIGFVFQSFNLVPTLNAMENITLPLDLASRPHDREWVDAVVRTVRLGDRLEHRPAELSGGQQQRVAVARALAGRPKIIFADEPTGNLDSRAGTEILRFMRQAVIDLDQTIVMVTHDPVAASYANRVLFLSDGQIVSQLFEPTSSRIIDHMKALGES